MAKTYIEKMEEAAGISTPSAGAATPMPYEKGERVPQGGVAKPWTGPKPWANRTYKGEGGEDVSVNKPQPVERPRTYQGEGGDVNVNK
jgi:hypothetical protein